MPIVTSPPAPRPPARPDERLARVGRVWVIRIIDRQAAADRFRPHDQEEGA
jgi:hypothetical protein